MLPKTGDNRPKFLGVASVGIVVEAPDRAEPASDAIVAPGVRPRTWMSIEDSRGRTVHATGDGWSGVMGELCACRRQKLYIKNRIGAVIATAVVEADGGVVMHVLPAGKIGQ